jgi:hypothetical protein
VTSFFPTRKLIREEFEQSDLDLRIDMTYETPEWDPTDTRFAVAEQSMTDDVGQLVEPKGWLNRTIVSTLLCCHEGQDASAFALAIMNNVKVKMIKAVTSRKGLPVVGPKLLAQNCWQNSGRSELRLHVAHGSNNSNMHQDNVASDFIASILD